MPLRKCQGDGGDWANENVPAFSFKDDKREENNGKGKRKETENLTTDGGDREQRRG